MISKWKKIYGRLLFTQMRDRLVGVHCLWKYTRIAGILGLVVISYSALASQSDFQLPAGLADPLPLNLSERLEKTANAQALYMQAIFEEETDGPDRALESKKRVLVLDPSFCDLALDVAQHYLRRGEITEALSVLKDASKASPRNASMPIALANIYLRQLEKPDLAEKFALLAHEISPNNADAFEVLWEAYRASGQNKKMEGLFQKALKSDSQDPAFWLDLADLRLRDTKRSRRPMSEGDWEKILALVDRAAQHSDKTPEILSRTADYYYACGDAASAAELYNAAFEQQPSFPSLKEKLAECHARTGKDSEAARLLEEVIAETPMNLVAYDQLALIRLRQNELESALATMRQALVVAPIEPRRYEDIIRIALRAGDSQTALLYANEAEQRFPYLIGFTLLRAISLSQAKQHAAALMTFERTLIEAANSNPEMLDSAFYMSYGAAAEQAGHFVKAAELIKTAISLNPKNSAEACNFLAYMWADRNENLPAAEELVLRALEAEPSNGAYLDTLGWVYFKQGRYSESLAQLLRAAELVDKPDPIILEHIGDAYEKLGKIAEAVISWQKAHVLSPENGILAEKIDTHSSKVAKQPQANP
jgi:tetratricopeptide (TPR) repeat protein